MVFEQQPSAIVALCPMADTSVSLPSLQEEKEQGSSGLDFWPRVKEGYANFGKVFVNNKKVEKEENWTLFSLEVLPEGCSNSHLLTLIHVRKRRREEACRWRNGRTAASPRDAIRRSSFCDFSRR